MHHIWAAVESEALGSSEQEPEWGTAGERGKKAFCDWVRNEALHILHSRVERDQVCHLLHTQQETGCCVRKRLLCSSVKPSLGHHVPKGIDVLKKQCFPGNSMESFHLGVASTHYNLSARKWWGLEEMEEGVFHLKYISILRSPSRLVHTP